MFQSDERPPSSGDGGHTQRASAMAALSSSINTSSKSQTQSHSGQGSQRAAAVAALSNVLTAEGSHSPHHSTASPTAGKTCRLVGQNLVCSFDTFRKTILDIFPDIIPVSPVTPVTNIGYF